MGETEHDPIAFADRSPTSQEVERLRLIMSTYQDGTGQIVKALPDTSFPDGWDFEACITAVFGGDRLPKYDKSVFDVLIPYPTGGPQARIGLSCKMRGELKAALKTPGKNKNGRVYMELTNANGALWAAVNDRGVTKDSIGPRAADAGEAVVQTVKGWHAAAADGKLQFDKSSYLALMWKPKPLQFKLYQFSMDLPAAADLSWAQTEGRGGKPGKAIRGSDGDETVYEWYFDSGGQFKYYARVDQADWSSEVVELEPLNKNIREGLVNKVEDYFPEKWAATFK